MEPVHSGTSTKSLELDSVADASNVPELMGRHREMEDLVRRYNSLRDAQGNAHNLVEDIRMSSLEALLPDDFEKQVQLNRARLTSYGVLREEIKTYK